MLESKIDKTLSIIILFITISSNSMLAKEWKSNRQTNQKSKQYQIVIFYFHNNYSLSLSYGFFLPCRVSKFPNWKKKAAFCCLPFTIGTLLVCFSASCKWGRIIWFAWDSSTADTCGICVVGNIISIEHRLENYTSESLNFWRINSNNNNGSVKNIKKRKK